MPREYEDQITDRVKELRGKTQNIALRFSIAWNECMLLDNNDLDAHCQEPNGNTIYYSNMRSSTGGSLDVDIITPSDYNKYAVENIVYPKTTRMPEGNYRFLVHCYSCRDGKGGFRAEIEFENKRYEFIYTEILTQNEKVVVADVMFKGGRFALSEKLKPVRIMDLERGELIDA